MGGGAGAIWKVSSEGRGSKRRHLGAHQTKQTKNSDKINPRTPTSPLTPATPCLKSQLPKTLHYAALTEEGALELKIN